MAEKLGDEQRLARVYTYLINYHYMKGEPELAIEYGERCLRIGDAAGDAGLQALARGYLGYSCHAQGQYRRAHSTLRENVEALELVQGEAPGGQAGVSYVTSSGWLAWTLAEIGEFDRRRCLARQGAAGGRAAARFQTIAHHGQTGRLGAALSARCPLQRASTPAARRAWTSGGRFPHRSGPHPGAARPAGEGCASGGRGDADGRAGRARLPRALDHEPGRGAWPRPASSTAPGRGPARSAALRLGAGPRPARCA